MTAPPRLLALIAASSILCLDCAGTGASVGVPGSPSTQAKKDRLAGGKRSVALVQVLHRAARGADGRLWPDAAMALGDAAVAELTGASPPVAPWVAVAGRKGRAVVVASPAAGALAQAVVERLRLAAYDSEFVTLVESGRRIGKVDSRASVILVVQPKWQAGRIEPDPESTSEGLRAEIGRAPSLVLADLIEPSVNGVAWRGDEIVASRSPVAVALAVHFILAARANRAVPDADALADNLKIKLDQIRWRRIAVPW